MIISDLEKREFLRNVPFFAQCSEFANKTFLITGSKGITGEGLIKVLLFMNERLHLGLHIYASTRNPASLPHYLEMSDPVTMCKFGEEAITLRDVKLDYIIHCAAPTERAFFIKNPVETIRVIVDETEKMLDLAIDKKVSSFLYLSSVEAYGTPNSPAPILENYVGAVDSLNIRSGYPLGKKTAEFLCLSYFQEYGVPTKIVRPSSIQGLFQPYSEQRVYNQILRCVIEKQNLIMNSDGSSKKSIVYPLDVISALILVLLKGENGAAYNITNPSTYMSVKETAEFVFKSFAPELKIVYDFKPLAQTGYLPSLCFTQNIDKLISLGWVPQTDLYNIYRVDIERFKK
jgi:UDP-glucuronate decarboxylase